jgi:hypothetical protein
LEQEANKMSIQKGDRVELTEISEGKQAVGGFSVGQTGTVVGEVAENYPEVKFDRPVTTNSGAEIAQTDCRADTLRKI